MGLPEFVDDAITDYTSPTPSIDVSKSVSKEQEERWKSNHPSFFEQEGSSGNVVLKPMITFVKESGCPNATKVNNTENTRKSNVKYVEIPNIPTVGLKVPTAKPTVAADKGNKEKVVKASTHWIWEPKQTSSDQGLNFNGGIPQDNIDDKGYWDSGCSRNMTSNISYLSKYDPFNGGYLSFVHGRGKITGKGSIKTDFKLVDDTHVLLRTPKQQNMYTINLKNVFPHKNLTCLIAKASVDEIMLWHKRLGHLNFKTMNKLVMSNLVKGLPSKSFKNDHSCVACLKGKQHKASFVTDDFSRFSWTFFLKSKDETSRILRNFITEIENLKDLKVKIIKSDNRGEFRNKEINEFCSRKGIKREFSNARTPQQNGVAERRNKTLIEVAWTMLADAKLPVTFWPEAVNTACYVQNRVLVTKPHNKTPYELFDKRSPAIGFLRPFGRHVMILNTLDHLGKFDAKGDESYFEHLLLTFQAAKKDDAILDNNSSQKEQQEVNGDKEVSDNSQNSNPTASLKISANDSFELASGSTVETEVPIVSSPVPTDSLSVPLVTSIENRLEDFFGDTSNTVSLNEVEAGLSNMETAIQTNPDLLHYCLFSCFLSQKEPKKIVDALKDPSWVEDIQQELLQFKIKNFWVLVDCPNGVRPIGTKWVLKNKKDERGIVIRNKTPGFQDIEFPHRVYKVERLCMDFIKLLELGMTIVATSTTEAEYVAATSGCGQVLWIQN
nr:hypothetical protein [Tanacetum cinerariifolium]